MNMMTMTIIIMMTRLWIKIKSAPNRRLLKLTAQQDLEAVVRDQDEIRTYLKINISHLWSIQINIINTKCEDKPMKMTSGLQQTNKQNAKPTSLLVLPSYPPTTVKTPSTLEPARPATLLGSLGPLLHEVALFLNKKRLIVYFPFISSYRRQFGIDMKWTLSWIPSNTCPGSQQSPTNPHHPILRRQWGRPVK